MDALNTHKVKTETERKIREWLHYVRGRAVGEKRRQVYWNVPHEACYNPDIMDNMTAPVIETEDMLVLEIPVRELASIAQTQEWYQQNIGGYSMERFDKMIRDHHNEEYLRKQHPGLQESWEKYQVMLALCSDKSFK